MTLLRPLPWTIAVMAVLLPVKLLGLMETAGLPALGQGRTLFTQARAAEHSATDGTNTNRPRH